MCKVYHSHNINDLNRFQLHYSICQLVESNIVFFCRKKLDEIQSSKWSTGKKHWNAFISALQNLYSTLPINVHIFTRFYVRFCDANQLYLFVMMIVSFNKWARRSFSLTHPRPRLRPRVGACSTYALHSHTHSYSIIQLYDCQVTKQSICAIFHRNPKRASSHCFHSIMIAFAIVAACFFMQFVMHIWYCI